MMSGSAWNENLAELGFNLMVALRYRKAHRPGEVFIDRGYRDRKTFKWVLHGGMPLIELDGTPIEPEAWMARPVYNTGSKRR